jgi:hypothetical protein
MRQVLMFCRIVVAETPKFENSLKQLDYRLREFFECLQNNRAQRSTMENSTVPVSPFRRRWLNPLSTRF